MSPYGHQPPPPPPSATPPYFDPPTPYSPGPDVPTPYHSLPPAPPPCYPGPHVPTPPYVPTPAPNDPYGFNGTGYDTHTPPSPGGPGYWHGGHIAIVVLVPIAGLCLLGLLAGLLLLARRRRREPEPECPPEEVQEVSEYVRVQEQVVHGPAGDVVVVEVLDEVIVQQEHGVVDHAHGRGEGPC